LQPASVPTPLKQGYVTLGSDGGHKGGPGFDGTFGLDDEALLNYGQQSTKKTHDVAVELIRRHYGRAAAKFYFIGNSQGGHEALDAAARYAADYDGVVSNFPAYNVTLLHLASLNVGKAIYANGGAGWLNAAKTKLLTDAVYAACDTVALDGDKDGIISNVAGCKALEDWVEKGQAPQTLVAVDENPKTKGRTRPMCRYPAWPRFSGQEYRCTAR
jgi:feruloyl esterase